jgi:hypothetical protein
VAAARQAAARARAGSRPGEPRSAAARSAARRPPGVLGRGRRLEGGLNCSIRCVRIVIHPVR